MAYLHKKKLNKTAHHENENFKNTERVTTSPLLNTVIITNTLTNMLQFVISNIEKVI